MRELSDKISIIEHNIINLYNYKKARDMYYDKYYVLEKYDGVKSAKLDAIIVGGCAKTQIDIIVEKEKYYSEYIYFKNKVSDVYNMLSVLTDFERNLLTDWYTTPKMYRKKAEDFAIDRGLSRRDFFRKKQQALKKIVEYMK
ncbi:hypothetical protein LJB88_04510 [Erysipelotrichaceae bacterium OttesenSCG-928-M19]|nr:hypothetical protein [Erysipelotrichaceae bacterium OttesenSCG-928-M19]